MSTVTVLTSTAQCLQFPFADYVECFMLKISFLIKSGMQNEFSFQSITTEILLFH